MGALKTKILYGIEWYRGLDLDQDNISVSVLPLVYDIVTEKCIRWQSSGKTLAPFDPECIY